MYVAFKSNTQTSAPYLSSCEADERRKIGDMQTNSQGRFENESIRVSSLDGWVFQKERKKLFSVIHK